MSAHRSPYPACAKCGADLNHSGELTLVHWVDPASDPEGKARLDLILDCEACGTQFNTYVALEAFVAVDVA